MLDGSRNKQNRMTNWEQASVRLCAKKLLALEEFQIALNASNEIASEISRLGELPIEGTIVNAIVDAVDCSAIPLGDLRSSFVQTYFGPFLDDQMSERFISAITDQLRKRAVAAQPSGRRVRFTSPPPEPVGSFGDIVINNDANATFLQSVARAVIRFISDPASSKRENFIAHLEEQVREARQTAFRAGRLASVETIERQFELLRNLLEVEAISNASEAELEGKVTRRGVVAGVPVRGATESSSSSGGSSRTAASIRSIAW